MFTKHVLGHVLNCSLKHRLQATRVEKYNLPVPFLLFTLLPARASEQGNVIGLVSMSSKKNCN